MRAAKNSFVKNVVFAWKIQHANSSGVKILKVRERWETCVRNEGAQVVFKEQNFTTVMGLLCSVLYKK